MKKSIVWTAAAVAAVGFGVPAFAAMSGPSQIRQIAPTPVVSVDAPDNTVADDSSSSVSVSLPDDTSSSIVSSVEDVSGNCDEAEHANDPECTGGATAGDDNSGPGSDNSGSGNSGDDSSGRSGNSGHGSDDSGSDDSGHGGSDG